MIRQKEFCHGTWIEFSKLLVSTKIFQAFIMLTRKELLGLIFYPFMRLRSVYKKDTLSCYLSYILLSSYYIDKYMISIWSLDFFILTDIESRLAIYLEEESTCHHVKNPARSILPTWSSSRHGHCGWWRSSSRPPCSTSCCCCRLRFSRIPCH